MTRPSRWVAEGACPECGAALVRTQSGQVCCGSYACDWHRPAESPAAPSISAFLARVAQRVGS